MSEVQKKAFGYQDDTAEELKGKSLAGNFGLNSNVRLTHFAYNANAGKDESLADAIDITVTIDGSEQRRRIYDITKVYNDDGLIEDITSDEWIEGYNDVWMQNSAMITHILKVFVDEAAIKAALAQPLNGFADWARVVTGLIPAGFETIPVDVFLEWQWSIPDGKDQTYLQLPKNMKGGYWICKTQAGTFVPQQNDKGDLVYINEQSMEHSFTRNKGFMEGAKAKKQTTSDALDAASAGGGSPQQAGW